MDLGNNAWIFLILFSQSILHSHICAAESNGHKIWEYLFVNNSYNNEVRPVKMWSTPTTVNVSVSVIAVIDFNEVKQTIVLTTKLSLVWKDEFLVWDPSNFENITHIHLSQAKVWKPYILLENSVSKQTDIGTPELHLIVSHDGSVLWNPVEVFQSTCAADVRKFPFDTQKCSMVFETIGYNSDELRMTSVKDHVDFTGYGITSGWSITATEMETRINENSEIHILCSLTLRRNPTYFMLNIFLPIVILSFMNIFVFILPVQSGEKASFVITVFLSLAVFLTIVSGNLPENSEKVSILNVYVFMCTLLSVIIAILTIIQIRIYHRDSGRRVSQNLTKFALMFTSRSNYDLKRANQKNQSNGHYKDGRRQTAAVDVMPLEKAIDANSGINHQENSRKATWPEVVRAFDNLFLVIFLIIHFLMTMVIFILAVQKDEPQKDHESH